MATSTLSQTDHPPRLGTESDKLAVAHTIPTRSMREVLALAENTTLCGHGSIIGISPQRDEIIIIPMTCKRWSCPRCAKRKRAILIEQALAGSPDKFITLTTHTNDSTSPRERLENAKKAFAMLVKRVRRKYGEFEYLLVWEVSENNAVHAHILARCPYIPQKWLSIQWKKLTSASVVDIRKIRASTQAARYVTKYLTKNADRTYDLVAPNRIVQRSAKFILHPVEEENTPTEPNYTWTWTAASVTEVLRALPDEVLAWTSAYYETGSIVLTKTEDAPCLPEHWSVWTFL